MAERSARALASGINFFLSVMLFVLVIAAIFYAIWVIALGPAWGADDLKISVPVAVHFDPAVVQVTGPGFGEQQVSFTGTHTEIRFVPRHRWQRWLFGVAGLVVAGVGIYLVRLLKAIVRSIGAGEPFAAANGERIRRGGVVTIVLTVVATVAKYLVGRSVIANLQTQGVELRPWFDPQVEFLFLGLLSILFGTLFQRGRELEEERSLTI